MTNIEKDNLKAEIEKQRLEFQRDAEKKIYEEIGKSLGQIFGDGNANNPQSDDNCGNPSENENKETSETKINFLADPMRGILIGYFVIVSAILTIALILCFGRHMCNNVCVVLVTILILATLVLVLAGRYCVVMMQLHNEKEKIDKKDEKKASKPEPTFKEKVLKRTQEALLEKVVEDTIKAFYK